MNHRHSLVAALASLTLFCLLVPASSGLTQSGPAEPYDPKSITFAPNTTGRPYTAPTPEPIIVPYPGGDDVPPPYDPATLPACEERIITSEMTQIDGPIDYAALPLCRLKISEITDRPTPPDYTDPLELSLGQRPGAKRPIDVNVAGNATVLSPNAGVKTWATQQFECLSACWSNSKFVWSLHWMSSARTPHRPSNAPHQWNKYTVAQRGHFGSNVTLTCEYDDLNGYTNTTYNVSLGQVFGFTVDFIETVRMRIFYETFLGTDCYFFPTEHWVDPDASMYYNIYATVSSNPAGYNYTGRIYVNNTWQHVFTVYSPFAAEYFDVGHEYTAHEGDIGTIEIPMNSVEQIRAKLDNKIYRLNKKVIPPWVTLTELKHDFDSPFAVFDESNESYVAVAAEASGGN